MNPYSEEPEPKSGASANSATRALSANITGISRIIKEPAEADPRFFRHLSHSFLWNSAKPVYYYNETETVFIAGKHIPENMIDIASDSRKKVERALLIGIRAPEETDAEVYEHLDELADLVRNLDIVPLAMISLLITLNCKK